PRIAPFYSPQLFQHPDLGRSPDWRSWRSRLHEGQLGWPFARRRRQRTCCPWMSTVCPAVTWAYSKSICQAVTVTIGAEAASMKLKVLGFCAIILAEGGAYSACAPLNCSFVAPYTSSPSLNPETSVPIASTIPDSSEPRIRGKGWS